MTMQELSVGYRAQAQGLKERIGELKAIRRNTLSNKDKLYLDQRIYLLQVMWREARDLAVLTERYYERGYRRNERYTL